MQDKLRCIDVLYQCIDGTTVTEQQEIKLKSDNRSLITCTSNETPPEVAVEKTTEEIASKIATKEKQANATTSGLNHATNKHKNPPKNTQNIPAAPAEKSLSDETSIDLFNQFMTWLPEEAVLRQDDISYIESPQTIEQFIDINHLDVSVGDIQQSLLHHGFVREVISIGKKKRISCLRLPEDNHV